MSVDYIGKFNVSGNLQFTKGIRILEDCEGTFNWGVSGDGADYAATFEPEAAMIGTHGIEFKTRATSPAADDLCQVERIFSVSESGILAMRGNFQLTTQTLIKYISMYMEVHSGTRQWNAKVSFDPQTPGLLYLNSANSLVAFAETAYKIHNDCWFQMELIIDTIENEYISARIGQIREDLKGKSLYDSAASTYTQINSGFVLQTDGNQLAKMYADLIYVGEYVDL